MMVVLDFVCLTLMLFTTEIEPIEYEFFENMEEVKISKASFTLFLLVFFPSTNNLF